MQRKNAVFIRLVAFRKRLKVYLSRKELEEESEVIRFAIQVGQAINTAHNNCVLHRDIKLENILWDPVSKAYRLTDFGLAKNIEDGSADTVIYTEGYGAPEIEKRLHGSYSYTADIYSFGITLYLLMNGLKFPSSEGYVVNPVQYAADYVLPAPERSSINFTRIIRKMCSYNSIDRYQSLQEILAALGKITAENGISEKTYDLGDVTTETYKDLPNVESASDNNALRGAALRAKKRDELLIARQNSFTIKFRLVVITALLLSLIFISVVGKDEMRPTGWLFVLSAVVITEGILQHMREMHITVGVIACAGCVVIGVYSGQIFICTMIFLMMITGISWCTMAGGIGACLWLLYSYGFLPGILGKLYDLGLGGLSIGLFLSAAVMSLRIHTYVLMPLEVWTGEDFADFSFDTHGEDDETRYEKMSRRLDKAIHLYSPFCIVLTIAGTVVLIIRLTGILPMPETLVKMHLIIAGIVGFVTEKLVRNVLLDKY
ncbi:MAG: protein kinase [Lachnospiraceae bacterium]|nr:protein kinase [Lachnospiraceae bacterium]